LFLYLLSFTYTVFTIIYMQQIMFLLYIFAGILRLQCTAHVKLFPMTNLSYFHICTSRKHVTLPTIAVFCTSLYVLSSYVVQIFSECLSDGSSCLHYYSWYNFYFDIGHTLSSIVRSLYLKLFGFSLYYIYISWNFTVY
jgi:hypothetical protein